jgi:SPP1 gp7 family putative phage head morphogenesis protein
MIDTVQNAARLLERFQSAPPSALEKESAVAASPFDTSELGMENPNWFISRKGMDAIDKMRRDDAFGAYMDMKKTARLSTDGKTVPASDEKTDVERAEFIDYTVDQLEGSLHRSLRELYSAMEYGYAIANTPLALVESGPFKGKIRIKALRVKRPHEFRFQVDDYRNVTGLLHYSPTDMKPTPLPLKDFIIYTYRKEFNNPYGTSDCERAYRSWNSKRWVMKMWDIWLERFAGGFLNVTTTGKTSGEEHAKAQTLMDRLSTPRTGWKHSDATTVEIVESTGRGHDAYKDAVAERNIYMARAVLLPDLLGLSQRPQGPGAFAQSKTHLDVFLWVLHQLGRDTEDIIMHDQFIKRQIDMNWPPSPNGYPHWRFEEITNEMKAFVISQIYAGVEKGVIKPDIEVENKVRGLLDLIEREEKEEEKPPEPPAEFEPPEAPPGGNGNPPPEPPEPPEGRFAELLVERTRRVRPINQYERKVNLAEFIEMFDTTEAAFEQQWTGIFENARNTLIDKVRKSRMVEGRAYRDVAQLQMPDKTLMQRAAAKFMLSGFLFGALQAQKEAAGAKTDQLSSSTGAPIVTLASDRSIITSEFEKRGLDLGPALKRGMAALNEEAFAIAGIESERVLSEAKQIVYRGMRRGDVNWTATQLQRVFEGYIKEGAIADAKMGETHRVLKLARRKFSEAINEGRRIKFEDPDVADLVVAYMWSSVLDSYTSPYCNAMDGKVFRKDELVSVGFPPAHDWCRSIVVPITRGEEFKFSRMPSGVERQKHFTEAHVCLA